VLRGGPGELARVGGEVRVAQLQCGCAGCPSAVAQLPADVSRARSEQSVQLSAFGNVGAERLLTGDAPGALWHGDLTAVDAARSLAEAGGRVFAETASQRRQREGGEVAEGGQAQAGQRLLRGGSQARQSPEWQWREEGGLVARWNHHHPARFLEVRGH